MYNLKQLIDRYENVKPSYQGIMSYLSLGGSNHFYLINSDEALQINSVSGGKFITDDNGRVQHYDLLEVRPRIIGYYKDIEYTIPLTEEEIANIDNLESNFDYYNKWNDEEMVNKWWGETLDKYYIHPWFPDKEIVTFETTRILPGVLPGTKCEAVGNDVFKVGKNQFYHKEECLEYPEFFKVIYK